MRHLTAALFASMIASATASAAPVQWADWQSASPIAGTVSGVLDGSPVTFSGGYNFVQTNGGVDYWDTSPATYTSANIDNGPAGSDIISLVGGSNQVYTINFAAPVKDLYFAMLSLGQPALTVQYLFDQDFVLENQGPGHFCSQTFFNSGLCSLSRPSAGVLQGNEGHGVIRFTGVFSQFSWTVPQGENWHGLTIGIARVATEEDIAEATIPAPAAGLLLLAGLVGLRRR